MARGITVLLAGAALAAAAVGCGGDGEGNPLSPTVESNATTNPPAEPGIDATSTTSTATSDGETQLSDSGIRPPPGGITQFSTPTKNIGCVIADDELRCDITDHSWRAPPKPASCKYDWGNSIGIQADRPAGFLCVSDSTLGSDPVLRYDTYVTDGDFRCESRADGLTCLDTASGNGFFLAAQEYRFIGS